MVRISLDTSHERHRHNQPWSDPARRVHRRNDFTPHAMPYSVGLVVAGILLARAPIVSGTFLSPQGIFTILLPPLIFEAALQIRWMPFRRELPVVLALAFFGVAIAAAFVATGMHFIVGWSWASAAFFGVLIAATDPVSVIAAFKEMKVEGRLSLLVEAESLLNDGAAAVGFAMLLAVTGGPSLILPPLVHCCYGR